MAVQQPEVAAAPAGPHTQPTDEKIAPQMSKGPEVSADAQSNDEKRGGEESDVEYDTKEKQYGVEKIRAITASWTWTALISVYAL